MWKLFSKLLGKKNEPFVYEKTEDRTLSVNISNTFFVDSFSRISGSHINFGDGEWGMPSLEMNLLKAYLYLTEAMDEDEIMSIFRGIDYSIEDSGYYEMKKRFKDFFQNEIFLGKSRRMSYEMEDQDNTIHQNRISISGKKEIPIDHYEKMVGLHKSEL